MRGALRAIAWCALACVASGTPPASQSRTSSHLSAEGGFPGHAEDGAVEAPECLCCEATNRMMEEYCNKQAPIMGDLEMNKFTCEDMPAIDPTGHPEWNCKCVCEKKLEVLRSKTCPMACKRLPLDCAHCAPPPPPPPPPPSHLTPDGAKCLPVEKKCCEATMRRLEKYCHAFRPIGQSTFVADSTHWDGGKWVVASSFDLLINQYWPEECTKGGPMEVTSVLSHVASFHHDNLCDAVEAGPCSDLCDRQCEPSHPKHQCTNCTGPGGGNMDIVKQIITDIAKKSAKGQAAEPTQAS